MVRSFYEYHREVHGRPLLNPFPKAKGVQGQDGRLNAHHNPIQPFYQPARPCRVVSPWDVSAGRPADEPGVVGGDHELCAVAGLKLGQEAADVGFHGADGEVEVLGNFGV